jgi:glycosyltransferase involved in cell wall biosynthesis
MTEGRAVSVVIPCYNYGVFLGDAVESVISQSASPLEIIVVDDGSSDDTRTVCMSFGPLVSYIWTPHAGLSSARNTGLARCIGEFVVFLDADDMLHPNYIACLQSVFASSNDDKLAFVYTQMELFGASTGITNFPDFSVWALIRENYIHASAMLRTSIARQVRYDETLLSGWEDWDFYLRLVERGYDGRLLNEPLLRYRQHDSPARTFTDTDDPDFRAVLKLEIAKRHPKLFRLDACSGDIGDPGLGGRTSR